MYSTPLPLQQGRRYSEMERDLSLKFVKDPWWNKDSVKIKTLVTLSILSTYNVA